MDRKKFLTRKGNMVFQFVISKSFGGVFTLSQQDIANSLKITRKTVVSTFAEMKKAGLIAKNGKVWVISPKEHFTGKEEQYSFSLSEFEQLLYKQRQPKKPSLPRFQYAALEIAAELSARQHAGQPSPQDSPR